MTEPIYLHDWKDGGLDAMREDFDLGPPWDGDPDASHALARVHVILASYDTGNYEGDAFVLFERDGKLWEVNGSHCSCRGLEGQWEPEETTVKALRHRLDEGTLGTFAGELREALDTMDKPDAP